METYSSGSHSILTKFTKLRKKPQQPLTDLTDLYSKIANESIFYLKLENQKQYQRALQGWKMLTTDTIFQLTRIEHCNRNRESYTKDELSIETGIKELYHKALRNMERTKELINESKAGNINNNESSQRNGSFSSSSSVPSRPMTARTMSAGFPRMTLRDQHSRSKEPRFPFVNYDLPTGSSHDAPHRSSNHIDNTKEKERRINFTTSKSLDPYPRDVEKIGYRKSDSDLESVTSSVISNRSNDSRSIHSERITNNADDIPSQDEIVYETEPISVISTDNLTSTNRETGIESESEGDPDFDVTDYYDDYLEVDSTGEESMTENNETNNSQDNILQTIDSNDRPEISFEKNKNQLTNQVPVIDLPKLPPMPHYIPPIPQAPVLIKEEESLPKQLSLKKKSSNEKESYTSKTMHTSNHKRPSKPATSLKQTKSTPSLPTSRPRHLLSSKTSMQKNLKSPSTLSLGSRPSSENRNIGTRALKTEQLEASQQAARMVLNHKQKKRTTRSKETSTSKSSSSSTTKLSPKSSNLKTKTKIQTDPSSKNNGNKLRTTKKTSPVKHAPIKRPTSKTAKKSKSLTLESLSSVDTDPTRSMSSNTNNKSSPNSEETSRTNSGLNRDSDDKNSLKESLEEQIIDSISGIDKTAAKQIFQEIVVQGDEVQWDDIAGLNTAKNSLKEAVVYPFLRPDLFKGLREPITGMLLFGPPGTGKTMLARAVAHESKSTFFSISASSLTSKYLGESEKLVRALFLVAKKLAPSIIFVDEIDSILGSRNNDGENESSRRIKNEFLIQWSSLSSAAAGNEKKSEGSGTNGREQLTGNTSDGDDTRVLVLAATNLPWSIDEAARRRFVRRQYIPLPEDETRLVQIKRLLSHQKHTLTDDEFDELMRLTDGYSGSDITSLAKDAAMGPLRELGDQLLFMDRENIRPMGLIDFKNSLEYIKPSVSKEGLEKYEEWAAKFGSSGI
ncbi:similar to Saccharomyces cerevisiae YPL074W YTA6 Putative ATPase of the CDC48/PAS1/SEC18 (AAA) family, localized to the cortex of mother cells but not to daughter cells [Maudiozyma saulgeensis]|uniref:Similar to Saccharomyces cerevisiae YPL074W YTA6 Putative ATPase of the CDC48/PAS1/SEC18 (AAA) family, localized to the cortex of mother cells but not to daughter cells n=1 Tax=Maudiozyma saulgeensis TaxID=1789683 RepID=A0A1X7R2T8_9SACH|nr:similar to Saccharomyces cerevisiae YPL074W YTA6 Putative ATPase of the CDC48/PAS1/SEC18 (AAA) family, localized to the cortex of mother cells but not to daughter cells [Kazachstania saulgeensis]